MSVETQSSPARSAHFALGLTVLITSALAMGASPVFVRFADVGPFAGAFWRVFLALPALGLWALVEEGSAAGFLRSLKAAARDVWVLASGLLFVGDLLFWHCSLFHTVVANATLLATLTPIWVLLGSNLILKEPVHRREIIGLCVCLAGGLTLVGGSYTLAPERLIGDFYGLMTSFFFGLYLLTVRRARRTTRSAMLTFVITVITAICIFAVACVTEPRVLPGRLDLAGFWPLLAMALISHAGGQGLLSVALGLLPASFSSLVIFLESVAAAGLAWIFLGEALGPVQIVGGVLILWGIALARPKE